MLNKPYKFQRERYDEILFTSDQHYSHDPKWDKPLWARRGFKSVESHDSWLRDQYSKVSANSIIFSLGDPALNSTMDSMLGMFNQTRAQIFHIWGNHFSCDYALYKIAMNTFLFENGFIEESDLIKPTSLPFEIYPLTSSRYISSLSLQNDSRDVPVISYQTGPHPLEDGSPSITFLGSQAIIQVNKQLIHLCHMAPKIWTRGAIALFGHSHGDLHGAQPEDRDGGKVLDCGIENSLKYNGTAFFTYEEVLKIMDKKPKISLDHAD